MFITKTFKKPTAFLTFLGGGGLDLLTWTNSLVTTSPLWMPFRFGLSSPNNKVEFGRWWAVGGFVREENWPTKTELSMFDVEKVEQSLSPSEVSNRSNELVAFW